MCTILLGQATQFETETIQDTIEPGIETSLGPDKHSLLVALGQGWKVCLKEVQRHLLFLIKVPYKASLCLSTG